MVQKIKDLRRGERPLPNPPPIGGGGNIVRHLASADNNWQHHLRGRIRENVPLAETNWFQVGGNAEYLFKPEDVEDLATFIQHKPGDMPVTIIGVGSNLLVRDGGIDGVVVRLGRGFAGCERVDGEWWKVNGGSDTSPSTLHPPPSTLIVGAACLDVNVTEYAAGQGIVGLEFLCGVPGTIGGAVKMNAGAYGAEMAQVVERVQIVDGAGEIRWLSADECGFSYRHSNLPEGAIITSAVLRGQPAKPEEVAARIADIREQREESQPIRSRTGGSTFKNPPGKKAWELIDAAGCRGLKRGGAQVSEKHCNFFINTGGATADDLEQLGEEVRLRVKAATGVELEWEIKRIGKKK